MCNISGRLSRESTNCKRGPISGQALGRRRFLQGIAATGAMASAGDLLAACGPSPTSVVTAPGNRTPKRGGSLKPGLTGGSSSDTIDPHKGVTYLDTSRLFAGFVERLAAFWYYLYIAPASFDPARPNGTGPFVYHSFSPPGSFFGPDYLRWTFSQDYYNYRPPRAHRVHRPQPYCCSAVTSVPTATDVTSAPTSMTVPANSAPRTHGNSNRHRDVPSRESMSE